MIDGRNALLCHLFDCGEADLELLDDVGYDWGDVLEQADWPGGDNIGINDIMRAVVSVGIVNIKTAIADRISELETIERNGLEPDEEKELRVLRKMKPDTDIRAFHNCRDTHIWCENFGTEYREYLGDAIDDFEENVGMCIRGI